MIMINIHRNVIMDVVRLFRVKYIYSEQNITKIKCEKCSDDTKIICLVGPNSFAIDDLEYEKIQYNLYECCACGNKLYDYDTINKYMCNDVMLIKDIPYSKKRIKNLILNSVLSIYSQNKLSSFLFN